MIKRFTDVSTPPHYLTLIMLIGLVMPFTTKAHVNICNSDYPYRLADASCNNLFLPSLGKNETVFKRQFLINNLPDKKNVLSGTDFISLGLPAPRTVSNAINEIQPRQYSKAQLSIMFVIFGQFMAHDLVDEEVDLGEFETTGDFRDANTGGYPGLHYNANDSGILDYEKAIDSGLVKDGEVYLAMQASKCNSNRQGHCEFINRVTHILDASNIYGSDAYQTAGLRTFNKGLLKTASYDIPVFGAPDFIPPVHLDNLPVTYADGCNNLRKVLTQLQHVPDEEVTCAGDSRAHENIMLVAIHIIWMREHNRIAAILADKHPKWDDEHLFQEARKYTSALYSKIVYDDWLPALLGKASHDMKHYRGYSPWVDPRIDLAFASAGLRIGHTMVPEVVTPQDQCLKSVINAPAPFDSLPFAGGTGGPFNIFVLLGMSMGIDPVLRHMGLTTAFEIDTRVEDSIRNIPNRNVVFDTLATNFNRARMNGIETYLQLRWLYREGADKHLYGLPGCPLSQLFMDTPDPIACFSHITGDDQLPLTRTLKMLYGKVSKIDAWVGMMAEPHMPNASVGKTVAHLMIDQFSRLRDGDRFYYENGHFDQKALTDIQSTTFTDIIKRNTAITLLPDDIFIAPQVSAINNYKADGCDP